MFFKEDASQEPTCQVREDLIWKTAAQPTFDLVDEPCILKPPGVTAASKKVLGSLMERNVLSNYVSKNYLFITRLLIKLKTQVLPTIKIKSV